MATLLAVLGAVSDDTAVMLPGGRPGAQLLEALDDVVRERLTVLGSAAEGFASVFAEALHTSGRADLVVVAGGWALPEGWLDGLRRAAECDDTVAAALPLVIGEGQSEFTALAVAPARGERPWSPGASSGARPVHPRVFALCPPFAYWRRATLELLGGPDPAFVHPASGLADLAARALACGLTCSLADDVLVEALGAPDSPPPDGELRALSARHPWLHSAREDATAAEVGPLRRALLAARVATGRPSVSIDARNLGASFGGTQTYTVALIRALALSGRVTVRAVVADDAEPLAQALFEDCQVEVGTYEQAVAGIARSDVVHRPHQVFAPDDLALLRLLGERLVISHLDLIAYRSPAYHRSPDDWRSYRRTTRLALGAADRVIFLSEHARSDAVAEELIGLGRTAVVGIGISPAESGEARPPERVTSGRPLLVMIGADYMHKNRPFALRLVDELARRHDWDGLLVLAGSHVPHGSSAVLEAELLRANPELAARVVDLGPIEESEKRWLLGEAQALLCPSTYEGFGLTPLEAAAAGVPCAYPPLTSLVDVLGREGATVVPWDPAASADALAPLLREGEERDRHLALLARALDRCDWASVIDDLCQVYADAIHAPFRASTPRAFEELEREQLMVRLFENHQNLQARIAHGLPLIDQGGLLTLAQQRGLMRIASRRWLRGPLLAPIGLLGELRTERERG